jgi:hypothetical protein
LQIGVDSVTYPALPSIVRQVVESSNLIPGGSVRDDEEQLANRVLESLFDHSAQENKDVPIPGGWN